MDDLERFRAVLLRNRRAGRPAQQILPQGGFGLEQIMNNRGRGRVYRYAGPRPMMPPRPGPVLPAPVRAEPCMERIKMEEDVLSYSGSAGDPPGLYVATRTIDHYNNYFEVEILDVGDLGQISIGLVPEKYSLSSQPGMQLNSVGYLAENGSLCVNLGLCHSGNGPPCGPGDRMGVGVRPQPEHGAGDRHTCRVFFSKNGQEIKSFELALLPIQLYPAVGMQSEGEEVTLRLDAAWDPDDVTQMMVDCGEEDWVRLDDVRLNGSTLEYAGRGRTIHDVGLAQAKLPLDTTNHYFEFEIVDPGEGCYVAIGLAKQNYPMRRHPGWNDGSIAYHADDGKLFHGSGLGVRFGPKCSVGDVMGCGIYFPPDYDSDAEALSNDEDEDVVKGGGAEEEEEEEEEEGEEAHLDGFLGLADSDEEELLDAFIRPPRRRQAKVKGTKVTVFFTRNGKLVGHREVRVPKGGFYPTVGMLSCNEKVRVDLRPLTG
ncbi:SPRY domain-containing protein 3 [Aplysia californica]|uniref:SPRY domain-containing protein 3 n=1 Tax=Aplysia californica TaxID=6500 RepID=A0ABM0K9H0_APLCA|nr:SPRY domain-containing protein 3 [Aplysia californica]